MYIMLILYKKDKNKCVHENSVLLKSVGMSIIVGMYSNFEFYYKSKVYLFII